MNASATTMVLLCSIRYHCTGSWRGRRLKHGLSLTEYPGQKGGKETDNLNAEVVQVTQGNREQVVWRLGSGGGGTAWWFGKRQIVWLPGEQGKGRGTCRGGQARLQELTSRAKELRSYPIASRESLRNFKQELYDQICKSSCPLNVQMFHEAPKVALMQLPFTPLWSCLFFNHIHILIAFLIGQVPWKQTLRLRFARGVT